MAGLCTYPLITQLCETPTHSHTTYTHTIALYPAPTSIMTSRVEVGMEVVTGYKAIPTHTLLIHHTHSPHPLIHWPSAHPLTPPTHPTHSPRPPGSTCGHCPLIDLRSLAACVMLGYFPTAPAHVVNKAISTFDVI